MKSKKIVVIGAAVLFALLLCISAGCVSDSTSGLIITNSDGSPTPLPGVPDRIVLLNSNAGEILYLLGDADKVIGISQSIANDPELRSMYPNAKVVGMWDEPNAEFLISLRTDVIIGYASSKPKNAEVFAAARIPIVYIDCTKPETMASDIREIGKLSGNPKKAEEVAAYYTTVMKKVADMKKIGDAASSSKSSPRIYAESYSPYYCQGTDSGMGQLITLTGGNNIFDEKGSRKVSDEWVVSSNPEIIVKLVDIMDTAEQTLSELKSRPGFADIPAVKNNKIWIIKNDITYGPRSCAAAVALLKMQNPELLPGMTPESVLKEFNEKFGTAFNTDNLTYPEIK